MLPLPVHKQQIGLDYELGSQSQDTGHISNPKIPVLSIPQSLGFGTEKQLFLM